MNGLVPNQEDMDPGITVRADARAQNASLLFLAPQFAAIACPNDPKCQPPNSNFQIANYMCTDPNFQINNPGGAKQVCPIPLFQSMCGGPCPPVPIARQYNQLFGNCQWQQVVEFADGSYSAATIAPADYATYGITPDSVVKYMTAQNYSQVQIQTCLQADFPGIPIPTPGQGLTPYNELMPGCVWVNVTPQSDGTYKVITIPPAQYAQYGITPASVTKYMQAGGYSPAQISTCLATDFPTPTPGTIGGPCSSTAPCGTGLSCVNGICASTTPPPPPPGGGGGIGATCSATSPCGTGLVCSGGVCVSAGGPPAPGAGGDNTVLVIAAVGLLGLLGLIGLAGKGKQKTVKLPPPRK